MNTIHQFASLTRSLSAISATLGDLSHQYQRIAERTALDEAHIDLLVIQAESMIEAANALKTIEFDPDPVDPELP
jgi:hypothetical protein